MKKYIFKNVFFWSFFLTYAAVGWINFLIGYQFQWGVLEGLNGEIEIKSFAVYNLLFAITLVAIYSIGKVQLLHFRGEIVKSRFVIQRVVFLQFILFLFFLLFIHLNYGILYFFQNAQMIRTRSGGFELNLNTIYPIFWQFQYCIYALSYIVFFGKYKIKSNLLLICKILSLLLLCLTLYAVGSRQKIALFFIICFYMSDLHKSLKIYVTLFLFPVGVFFVAFMRDFLGNMNTYEVLRSFEYQPSVLIESIYDRITASFGFYYSFQEIYLQIDSSIPWLQIYIYSGLKNIPLIGSLFDFVYDGSFSLHFYEHLYQKDFGMPPGFFAASYLAGGVAFLLLLTFSSSVLLYFLYSFFKFVEDKYGNAISPYLVYCAFVFSSIIFPSDLADLKVCLYHLLPFIFLPLCSVRTTTCLHGRVPQIELAQE